MTVTVVSTPPPPSSGALDIPTVEDEKATYLKWGWTWTPSKEPSAVTEPVSNYIVRASDVDIHADTEGDDLWSHLMMFRRSNNAVYLNRARAWLRYFKEDYRTNCSAPDSFCSEYDDRGLDHLWGWGLVAWYEHSCQLGGCDLAALAEAENLAAVVETLHGPNSTVRLENGLRKAGRHLLLVTRVAEATGNTRWVQLRDRILNRILAAPEWDAARGMYFSGQWSTDTIIGAGSYAAGIRIQSPFQVGVLAEALYQAYRVTGRAELRDRLVAMAEFAYQHGLDPTYQYTSSSFGLKGGQTFHSNNRLQSPTRDCSVFWDPPYTTSLVNTLVMGYKLTGERRYYDRAKIHFNRGTKGLYGKACDRTAADGVVHHFVDTVFSGSSGSFYLSYNKGELQYTYLLFENGGLP